MANNFNLTITATDKVSATINRITKSINRITKPASDLKASFSNLNKNLGLDRVADSIKSVGQAAGDTARQLSSVVTPLSVIGSMATIAGIAALANQWGKMGAEVERTSSVLGVSTDQLQAYRGAAKLAGLSADDMTGSLKSLGTTIEDATFGRNQEALVMMHKFGVSLHRTKDGAVDATRALKDVANAIVAQKGNVQAQAIVARTFGVESLLPMLQKGSAGIDAFVKKAREMGLVFDKASLDKGNGFNQSLLNLEALGSRLELKFGGALAPAVQRVVDVVGRLVDKYGDLVATKVAECIEKLAHWIDTIDWDKTVNSVGKFVDSIGGVKGIAVVLAAISFSGPILGVTNLITSLGILTLSTIPAAIKALELLAGKKAAAGTAAEVAAGGASAATKMGGAVAGGAIGYWLGSKLRPYYDNYVRWATNGKRWSLNDYLTGTNRKNYAATGGYTQEELDSMKDGGGAKLSGAAQRRLGAADLFSNLESKYGLPAGLLDSVWSTESQRGANMGPSRKGALGHFQFMPDTAKQYGLTNPNDLKRSATAAAQMYSDLLKANGGDLDKALAAYNWGQGNLNKKGLLNAPTETQDYIAKVEGGMGFSSRSLYARGAGIVAANQPNDAGPQGEQGSVRVEVILTNAPAGTKTHIKTAGNVTATARVGHPSVGGPQV